MSEPLIHAGPGLVFGEPDDVELYLDEQSSDGDTVATLKLHPIYGRDADVSIELTRGDLAALAAKAQSLMPPEQESPDADA